MTVSYSATVSHKRMGNFVRLLFRWRGSIYKLLYKELLIFWLMYATVNLLYRFCFAEQEQKNFEYLCAYFDHYTQLVPLTFILGFYVSMVVERWWKMYTALAWPDNIALILGVYIPENDYQSRLIRRTLIRWMCLANISVMRSVSSAARKRFPTQQTVREIGLLLPHEADILNNMRPNLPSHEYWVPIKWCLELLRVSQQQEKVPNERYLIELVNKLQNYRRNLGMLLDYDWISVPLVYTQVVTLAVYSFFGIMIFTRQYLGPNNHETPPDGSFRAMPSNQNHFSPIIFSTMQFLFYMGWLKVAETLINPLAEDDDDFEINWLIDRNVKFSFVAVDHMFDRVPNPMPDKWWDDPNPKLPYTKASLGVKDSAPKQSQSGVKVDETDSEIVPPKNAREQRESKPTNLFRNLVGKLGFVQDRGEESEDTPSPAVSSRGTLKDKTYAQIPSERQVTSIVPGVSPVEFPQPPVSDMTSELASLPPGIEVPAVLPTLPLAPPISHALPLPNVTPAPIAPVALNSNANLSGVESVPLASLSAVVPPSMNVPPLVYSNVAGVQVAAPVQMSTIACAPMFVQVANELSLANPPSAPL